MAFAALQLNLIPLGFTILVYVYTVAARCRRRTSLAGMATTVAVLLLVPAPGLAELDGLAAEMARAGVRVEVRIGGSRPDLRAGVNLSAYRIVQEALTNVVRHAGPATARVGIRYTPDEVTVEVVDDGRPKGGDPGHGGHGIIGMRERAALYGGDLEAGPLPCGGFRVAARLPPDPPTTAGRPDDPGAGGRPRSGWWRPGRRSSPPASPGG